METLEELLSLISFVLQIKYMFNPLCLLNKKPYNTEWESILL